MPADLATNLPSCPHPPAPLPLRGRGRLKVIFMQGASPLASPRLNPGGAGFSFGKQCPKGGLSPGLPAGSAVPAPEGGLVFRIACLPCHLFAVFPPSPRPPSPPWKGENHSFLMQGASPLASPGLSRRQHGLTLRNRYPAEACPAGCRLTVPLWCPQGGGLAFLVASLPLP